MGNRHQQGKGYTRRHQDKHHDRDKNNYQKGDRKGLVNLMEELKAMREQLDIYKSINAGQKLTINQLRLEKEQAARKAYREGAVVTGVLTALLAGLLHIIL